MAEERPTQGTATAARCPWCSAELSTAGVASCPSCGATLVEPDASVPGVNAIDAEAIARNARLATPVRRTGLLAWISGDDSYDDETPAPPGSLAPPPPEVRREILRLELEAEYANLQAQADSIVSEAEAEAREGVRQPATESEAKPADAVPPAEATADDAAEGPTQPV
jgi:hypothetical protein